MSALELKIPPPVVAAVVAALMWLASWLAPAFAFELPGRGALAPLFAATGILLDLVALASFRRASTTVNPLRPAGASTLVTSGLYRFSRNPMYLGNLLILIGWALWMSNLLSLAAALIFILYMNRFQIGPEERMLDGLFGEQFAAYRKRVRRWL